MVSATAVVVVGCQEGPATTAATTATTAGRQAGRRPNDPRRHVDGRRRERRTMGLPLLPKLREVL